MESPTIYIVDDDQAVRDSVSLLVRSYGMNVQSFESAEAFLRRYKRGEPGLLVLDLHMPGGLSGVDLQDILAGLCIRIPIIIITAYKDHTLAERAKAAGAFAVFSKPFGEEALVECIQHALEQDTPPIAHSPE